LAFDRAARIGDGFLFSGLLLLPLAAAAIAGSLAFRMTTI
jgi:hypothetical protein